MWEKYKNIVPHISVGNGVIDTVAQWVCAAYPGDILVVCDPNTRRIAGTRVLASLKAAGLKVTGFCFAEDEPLPDEHSVGRIVAALNRGTSLILGIGSGTINDLCTYVGAQTGCPTAIVGTAPSMDGYASLGSAMLFNGVKVTPPTRCPEAIFCDTGILAGAPMNMIAAGLGDMLGKITSLADWRLSHVLTGEPIPMDVYDIMKNALDKILASASGAAKRDPAAIESITEGLILSGIAMSLYGDSRPASGTEHHLAHFWEMRMLAEGRKPALHGTKVGVAAVLGLEMWRKLADYLKAHTYGIPQQNFPLQSRTQKGGSLREHDIRRLYGTGADVVLETENPNLPPGHIADHRNEILEIANSLPSPEEVAAILSSAGIEMRPKDINLSSGTLHDSIIYARERKKTYTLLQLLGDLGLLEEFAVFAGDCFVKNALSGVKCFVLDMDGTIYLGNRLFPYTQDFLKHLGDLGIDYLFFTNNSSQNAGHYIKKLHGMGITIPGSKLLMSTHVLLDYLECIFGSSSPAVFVAGTKALKDDFEAAGYVLTDENPGFCVLGFDMDMDYERLAVLCDHIRAGVPVYGVNMDYNCPVDGGFVPDCGSLAAAVHASTGVQPEFFGKPSRRALDYIIKMTGYREDELCFVGDRLYTDIAITDGTKARSALVLSGETKRGDLAGSASGPSSVSGALNIPDVIVEDLKELGLLISSYR